MSVFPRVTKCVCVVVALFAVFVGLLVSGAFRQAGVFRWLDGYRNGRGAHTQKGLTPIHHEGEPWRFTHQDLAALDLSGDTILVTGGNAGLGYWTAYHLAARGATVVIGCRSQKKCDAAAASIEAETGSTVATTLLDLSSFASIRACAQSLQSRYPQLDSLVLNAGIMVPPFSLTRDGLESQIGTNHFGHFLLTDLLLPQVEAAAKAKGVATIVPVSSSAHFESYPEGILASVEAMNDESKYSRLRAYGQSKLANVLYAQELAERLRSKNILVNAIHPGFVATQLGRHVQDIVATVSQTLAGALERSMAGFAWHPRDAALTQLHAAVNPELKNNKITGQYFHPIARVTEPDVHAQGAEGKKLRKHLWALTEAFIAQH